MRRLGHSYCNLAHAAAHLRINDGRRSFLKNFLMAALDGALALPQIDGVAMFVGQHLHFDVARIDDGFLDVDFVVAEGALGFALRGFERGLSILAARAPTAFLCRRRRPRLST
jgi:hypothetical protein